MKTTLNTIEEIINKHVKPRESEYSLYLEGQEQAAEVIYREVVYCLEAKLEAFTKWIPVEEKLPPPITGWNHSAQVLVKYRVNEHNSREYGMAYYHYKPPFSKPGFTDFCYDAIITHWREIQ